MKPFDLMAVKSAASSLMHSIDRSCLRVGDSRNREDSESSRAIFAFLDKLAEWPDGFNEMQRRAGLVSIHCGSRSSYAQARKKALRHIHAASKDEAINRVEAKLMATPANPAQLAEVDDASQSIERWLTLQPSSAGQSFLNDWLGACRDLQQRADGLHVDGCWLLDQHLREQQVEPQNGMGFTTALTRSVSGAWNRAQIRSAVASLIEPIDRLPSDPPATRRKGNKGRPPRSKANLQTDETLVNDWEKARESGVAKKDFTKDRGMTVRELDRVVDRFRKRGKRSQTKS